MAEDKFWNDKANKLLQGKTIRECRYMTKKEADAQYWSSRPVVIIFTDGTYMYPMSDDEGNDGGSISMGSFKDKKFDEGLPVLS